MTTTDARADAALTSPLAGEDELPFRRRDIERGLILFRTSNNAHGLTNFVSLTERVDALPQAGKDELASMMRNIAQGLSPAAKEGEPTAEQVERAEAAWNEVMSKGPPARIRQTRAMRAALKAAGVSADLQAEGGEAP